MNKPQFSRRFLQELAEHNPLGLVMNSDDVQAWFDWIWLRYSSYGYRKHNRTIRRWFAGVTEADMVRAWDRRDQLKKNEQLEAAARLQAEIEQQALQKKLSEHQLEVDPGYHPNRKPASGIFR